LFSRGGKSDGQISDRVSGHYNESKSQKMCRVPKAGEKEMGHIFGGD